MFAVLVPLKRPSRAKTRLARSGIAHHQELARSFAWDTIDAATASPLVAGVWVVTEATELVPESAAHLPDHGAGDLNRALVKAADDLRHLEPDLGVAALCGDLPALRADDLTVALAACTRRSFVADATGTGTTLLASPGGTLEPLFGSGSAAAHAESGALALSAPLTTLRLDVDTAEDLDRALALGVGPHTARVLHQWGIL